MEMLARRTAMAERQVARQLAREARKNKKDPLPHRHVRRETAYHIAMAREARKEDWEMGPLAPQRDVPSTSLTRFKSPLFRALGNERDISPTPSWGQVSREIANPSFELLDRMKEDRWAWAGGSKHPNLAVGDRVVVIEGTFKGLISTVKEINFDNASLTLADGTADVNVEVPSYIPTPDNLRAIPVASSFPVSAVRLVHPLKDPETGETRDVIIKSLVATTIYHDRPTRRVTWSRIVPGLNVRIPWPIKEPPRYEDYPSDTTRAEVEKRTFRPTLLNPPMPPAVLDELRNRFSIFRTRHTEEYIAQKEAEHAAKKAKQAKAKAGGDHSMRTPLQELNKHLRDARRARGQPVLSDEMLANIGRIMAAHRARTMAAAGISDVTPAAVAAVAGSSAPAPASPEVSATGPEGVSMPPSPPPSVETSIPPS